MININRIIERAKIKSKKEEVGIFMPVRSRWKSKLQSMDNFNVNSLEFLLLKEIIYLQNELSTSGT